MVRTSGHVRPSNGAKTRRGRRWARGCGLAVAVCVAVAIAGVMVGLPPHRVESTSPSGRLHAIAWSPSLLGWELAKIIPSIRAQQTQATVEVIDSATGERTLLAREDMPTRGQGLFPLDYRVETVALIWDQDDRRLMRVWGEGFDVTPWEGRLTGYRLRTGPLSAAEVPVGPWVVGALAAALSGDDRRAVASANGAVQALCWEAMYSGNHFGLLLGPCRYAREKMTLGGLMLSTSTIGWSPEWVFIDAADERVKVTGSHDKQLLEPSLYVRPQWNEDALRLWLSGVWAPPPIAGRPPEHREVWLRFGPSPIAGSGMPLRRSARW